jgi:hypothetical protein
MLCLYPLLQYFQVFKAIESKKIVYLIEKKNKVHKMKKIIIVTLLTLTIVVTSFSEVSADTVNYNEVYIDSKQLNSDEYDIELQKMRNVRETHYLIDCNSKSSRDELLDNEELTQAYDDIC